MEIFSSTNTIDLSELKGEQEGPIFNLPNEILDYIFKVKPIEDIDNWNDIFESPKIDLRALSITCKLFNDLCKYSLESLKELKEKKFNQLLDSLVTQSLIEYEGFSKEELNRKLVEILNRAKFENSKEKLKEAVKLILAGADVDIRSYKYRKTSLMYAAESGYKEIVEILLNKKADVDAKDKWGYTALMLAVFSGKKDVVEIILNAGADVDAKGKWGYTALIWATLIVHKRIIEILIKAKANVNIKDDSGNTALVWATKNGNKEIIEMLK